MNFKSFLLLSLGLIFFITSCKLWEGDQGISKVDFVTVKNTGFEINGVPYHYLGTNFWYGANIGGKREGGKRERLIRELDRLKALGITNLRIMGGTEGPDSEPYRIVPSLQFKPGMYNRDVFDGLDFLLDEMKKRKMYAVVCLNNFWNWSGGMAQYLVWAGAADSIPYPPPHLGGRWDTFQKFAAQFYSNEKAKALFNDHVEFMISRKNSISGINYKNDPTIMAWELANEPRGVDNIDDFRKWIDATAALIKKLDPNHLVTTGSEGKTTSPASGNDLAMDHASQHVDYATIHIWVQNWGLYDPARPLETYDSAVQYAVQYIDDQARIARKINKPLVLEEFGMARDDNSYVVGTSVSFRDKYYARLFDEIYKRASSDSSALAGVNFWAWSGEGRPRIAGGFWKPLDDFIGDPPHEPQGWYSVYDTDTTTTHIIKRFAEKMNNLKN